MGSHNSDDERSRLSELCFITFSTEFRSDVLNSKYQLHFTLCDYSEFYNIYTNAKCKPANRNIMDFVRTSGNQGVKL